jgi:RimJ/RimL family protein N-acetyltransferase
MTTLLFRDPVDADAAGLTVLADAATRRLVSRLWDDGADPGQSSFEVGREVIRSDTTSLSHLSRWRVVDHNNCLAGGLNSYRLPPPGAAPASAATAAILEPLTELKAVAEGTWYVSVASIFPEFRGQGIGQQLFVEAERLATEAAVDRITLLVASVNEGAYRLYRRLGFQEWERRPFVPFPGSDEAGDWILMVRDLA